MARAIKISDFSSEDLSLLEELYFRYRQNSGSVTPEWKTFFDSYHNGGDVPSSFEPPKDFLYISQAIIDAYRDYGHLSADIDPLGLRMPDRSPINKWVKKLGETELNTRIDGGAGRPLGEVIAGLEDIYCQTVGFETWHMDSEEEKRWFYEKAESGDFLATIDSAIWKMIYKDLAKAELFEKFLGSKYLGKKRFSLEGGESLIVLLNSILNKPQKTEGVVIAMAHRGRLNVLANVLEKPLPLMLAEFEENFNPQTPDYSDVKYHLGYSSVRKVNDGEDLRLTLLFNPSHLEAVYPLLAGSVRARQTYSLDENREKFWGIVIHGDAAFSGQGVVAETLNMANMDGYRSGGVVHIVLNNQIGFTTDPDDSHSGRYATDLAKGFHIPIIHVNGDDAGAVWKAGRLALEYRDRFKKDIILDLVVYRKLGHNEVDEPSFTHPFLYKVIQTHPSPLQILEEKMSGLGFSKEFFSSVKKDFRNKMEEAFNDEREKDIKMEIDTMQGRWGQMYAISVKARTVLKKDELQSLAKKLLKFPDGFKLHPKLERYFAARSDMYEGKTPLDWAGAESLALASLLEDGFRLRFTGQDVARGTFSHRHAVLSDNYTGTKFSPFENISPTRVEFVNTPLSELSVLGYEFGYSLTDPMTMVIWEAQFGDFANQAQMIFDQFIVSAEQKWYRKNGLTILLPHGYEGQGPEHSSARIERFLQMASHDNLRICNLTHPSQYYHALRRQMIFPDRKPLLIFTPKSLLRLFESTSTLSDLYEKDFLPVIDDTIKNPERVVFCSGKFYFDLHKARKDKKTALVRIEQYYPFAEKELKEILARYSRVKEFVWAQEEPENMGAAGFLVPRLQKLLLQDKKITVVARPSSAATAEGLHKLHIQLQEEIIRKALGISKILDPS